MTIWQTLLFAMFIENEYPEAEITCFENGDDAWQEVSERAPDLFVLDGHHPGMSSIEMVRQLATRSAEFPQILMSGMESQEALEKWFDDETKEVFGSLPAYYKPKVNILLKPFMPEELLVMVKELLDR